MMEEPMLRIIFTSIFMLTLSISAYYRRRAMKSGERPARRQEGALALGLRATMGLSLLLMLILHAAAPRWMEWAAIPVPTLFRWLGAGLGIACALMIWWVFDSIGSNISETVLTKRDHQLVTNGPYRWIRHPLYSVALIEIFALSLIAGSWPLASMCLIGWLAFRWVVIPIEETRLVAAFGREYEQYRAQTGALVPRIRS
jgi:protein-S-isoprenylcysteine O-methyltransferase Ste14